MSVDSVKAQYTQQLRLHSGVWVVFRPIECGDQQKFKAFFKSLSPASVHFRFLEMIKELPNETVRRYCNLDYNKEIAIVAQPQGQDQIVAVGRLMVNRELRRGEFALTVTDTWQGVGLGWELLEYIKKIALDYGLAELFCVVSTDNVRMVRLANRAGLRVHSTDGDTVVYSVALSDVPLA